MLKEGDTIQGLLAYSPLVPGGLLKVKNEETIKTYTPAQVESFWFYDEKNKRNSTFLTLPG